MLRERAIAWNRGYAAKLGWTPADLGADAFDGVLLTRVAQVQHDLGVEADGLFGPASYGAWLTQRATALSAELAAAMGTDAGATAAALILGGQVALTTAKALWLRTVVDPPDASDRYAASRAVVDALIRSDDGLGWSWEKPYRRNGDYEWCGSLAAWGWRAAGVPLAIRKRYFSSTYRLDRFARYRATGDETPPAPPDDARRLLVELDEDAGPDDAVFPDGTDPRAGDILLVGGERTGYGKHICLVEAYDPATGLFTTIEGNGTGASPRGGRIHGIVRAQRPVGLGRDEPRTRYHARRLIRPSIHDLTVVGASVDPGGRRAADRRPASPPGASSAALEVPR
ncbi:MAG: hypothetical protein R3B06_12625 [Kofleriaceae bacterium]